MCFLSFADPNPDFSAVKGAVRVDEPTWTYPRNDRGEKKKQRGRRREVKGKVGGGN